MTWFMIADWEVLAQTAHYNNKRLAELCHISPRQLQRVFRHTFGKTPQAWLDDRRIEAAQRMLLTGKPVKRVAFELGYKQSSHFCRQFKTHIRITPTQFVVGAIEMSAPDNRCRSQITIRH